MHGGGGGMHGRRDGHCSGQYASYWIVFLFIYASIVMSGMPEFSDLLEKAAFTELPAAYFTKIHLCLVTAHKQSLGQGNVFTSVCHSVRKGGSESAWGGRGGSASMGMARPPPALQDMVKKWTVHILLECILVSVKIAP